MRSTVRGAPTWIASGDGELAAWVHRPLGEWAVGAVVMVPPVGRELVVATRAWHVLATDLARAGQLVVRFALRGDGDSSPLAGPDPVAQWLQDVDAAVDLAERLLPEVPVTLVGLRIGASLAARATHPAIARRLLWEPVSGRRFLRAQAALRKMSVPQPPVDGPATELPGTRYTPEQARAIQRLAAPQAQDPGRIRQERDRDAAARLFAVHPAEARLPREVLAQVVDVMPAGQPSPLVDWQPRNSMRIQVGQAVVEETFVEVGPHSLPGIVTRPATARGRGVLLCPSGSEPKDGPTGLWTVAARALAAHGATCLRMERRGTGDALDPMEETEPLPYRDAAVEDVVEGAGWLRAQGLDDLAGVGLSAGCWVLAKAAAQAGFGELVLVNNIGWFVGESHYEDLYHPSWVRRWLGITVPTGDEQDEADPPAPTPTGRGQQAKRLLKEGLVRSRDAAKQAVPSRLRPLLARVGLAMDPAALVQLVPPQTIVHLWFGERDTRGWRALRGRERMRVLERKGWNVEVTPVEVVDHALLSADGRRWVIENLVATLTAPATAHPDELADLAD